MRAQHENNLPPNQKCFLSRGKPENLGKKIERGKEKVSLSDCKVCLGFSFFLFVLSSKLRNVALSPDEKVKIVCTGIERGI